MLMILFTLCLAEKRDLFLVMLEGDPVAFLGGSQSHKDNRVDPNSEVSKVHAKRLVDSHDQLLQSTLERGSYSKLCSFKHILNGFAVHTTPSQASKLKHAEGVKLVERDRGARLMTTYTPQFLEIPQGVWTQGGGERNAGEGIVIGFVDTGIVPTHPSFAFDPHKPFASNISFHFSGACETGPRFPASSCNGKIVSARFFSAGAQAAATLNASVDFLSPFDAVGHGSHVASTAAGNGGVPVVVNGFFYGRASGMAPRARIAVYKAVYPTVATLTDVVSAIDQGFFNGTSSVTSIIYTAKALGFVGFLLVANPSYGDFIAEPIPFDVSGILIPKVADVNVILHYYEEHTRRDEKEFVRRFRAKAAIGEGRVASFKDKEPAVSRFSSRGPDFIDANRNPADVLKPDILAPGHQVWAAWSPISASNPILEGLNFALLSGTSMAAPHVAGIAALIKQCNPLWTPSMIMSAIATTATKYDANNGQVIMAEGFGIGSLYPSTPFEFGSGLVSPKRAIDPGLVFSTGYEDYIAFLCSLPGMNPATIKTALGESCKNLLTHPANLNLPSITISALIGSRLVQRTVRNVQGKPETYLCAVLPPNGTTVSLNPPWFTIAPQGTQELDLQFNVTKAMDDFSFGEIVLTGSLNHIIRIPLSVYPISVSNR
ncbi:Subtilase [Parasponia andersonii]|uniref:Subtilase n=1 Tax=Parasponia andersonii TaxID=3476 RepID=A0A2P5BTN6_PARAD|nr:Subtilase [Parasponia andersonii]